MSESKDKGPSGARDPEQRRPKRNYGLALLLLGALVLALGAYLLLGRETPKQPEPVRVEQAEPGAPPAPPLAPMPEETAPAPEETTYPAEPQKAAPDDLALADLTRAMTAMASAKASAEALDADVWAKASYDEALAAEQETTATVDVASKQDYEAATQLFLRAARETRALEPEITAHLAEAAQKRRDEAHTETVTQYAALEFLAAEELLAQAPAAEGLEAIIAAFKKAEEAFADLVTLAAAREVQASDKAEAARAAAQIARDAIGDDERTYAAAEIASAEEEWAQAGAAGNQHAAVRAHYEAARTLYRKAIEETPERKKSPAGPRPGSLRQVDLGGGVTLSFAWIPPGEFMMGAEAGADQIAARYGGIAAFFANEQPRHRVTIAKGFWLATCEVTNAQYARFDAAHASGDYLGQRLDGGDQPVVYVSWNEAAAFCAWLATSLGEDVRLPREAEWEYACRAGSQTEVPWGAHGGDTGAYANIADLAAKSQWDHLNTLATNDGYKAAAPAGRLKPNAWGLHDMIGNVWEWCADYYAAEYYANSPTHDPQGPAMGAERVLRGGAWYDEAAHCRAATRFAADPAATSATHGFRVAIIPR